MTKKILILLLMVSALAACTKAKKWSEKEREAVRNEINAFRTHHFLSDMTDGEYAVFAETVTTNLENKYPDAGALNAMPGMNDTIAMVVVETIGEGLDANYKNMRFIFPYSTLVVNGILPEKLSKEQLDAYYSCLASKVNATFPTKKAFLMSISNGVGNSPTVLGMLQECAVQLGAEMATQMQNNM